MKKRILYGNANYEEIVSKNGYFVDKTAYIEKLEMVENPVFLRPRRFGKSLWCRILECYYNIRQKDDFDRLFGNTYIGKNPTPLKNSFFVLHLDFSVVDPTGTIEDIEESFNLACNLKMDTMVELCREWFQNSITIDINNRQEGISHSASANLGKIMQYIEKKSLPPLYIIIDEYDNFANQLIIARDDKLYRELTKDDGFLKTFFKTLKEGRKTGAINNVFITGVLPITIDELASGFNIARFITLNPKFENMLGFTQAEVDTLLDAIYSDYEFEPSTRHEVDAIIKNHYNGYHFVNPKGKAVYNSTILSNFLVE
ncbi:MAG: AAA family ATPase [Desulfamplus sp.]|nr:AAA family ATPase [Desulfamplus sp.]